MSLWRLYNSRTSGRDLSFVVFSFCLVVEVEKDVLAKEMDFDRLPRGMALRDKERNDIDGNCLVIY